MVQSSIFDPSCSEILTEYLQVQGHHGIGFATAKPAYGTYKSPYGPKYASSTPSSQNLCIPRQLLIVSQL